MTSFADLTGILLATFVLLLSMSSLGGQRWGDIVQGFASTVGDSDGRDQRAEARPVPRITPGSARPVAYLRALLSERWMTSGARAPLRLEPMPDGLAIDLDQLDDPRSAQALTHVLGPIANELAVISCRVNELDWASSMADAASYRARLAASGLVRPVSIAVSGGSGHCPAARAVLLVRADRA